MAKTLVGALALAALPSALAFRNTSPFFLFSTAQLNIPNPDQSIAQASHITTDVLNVLKGCPTRSYVLIEQLGVSSADYVDDRLAPRLSQYMSGKDNAVKTTFAVPEVVGEIDQKAIKKYLEAECGHKGGYNVFEAASSESKMDRRNDLQKADDLFEKLLVKEARSEDYTVIYSTTPPSERASKSLLAEEHPPYEMENTYGNYDQMELKRDLSSHVRRANSTNSAGLFERYQYFTPGLFMAFSAIVPLFLILLVGIRALTSLEVSYFAFSKEMGPNAQKKQ
ncbi:BIG1-domain-containing protein [Setomelanomma holmii]|uniref:Protein BIG1 n=1 Tax=Setomelanomma holmii TaxID=210430 RepID=A0A9P4LQW1_9PLEO|nr:BIG1-domain-containing protein [Setomelanomma holmii]